MTELTPRQMKVAELVACGLANKQIAQEMGVCKDSADVYISRLGPALNLRPGHTRVQIALWYLGQCDTAEREAIIAGRRA